MKIALSISLLIFAVACSDNPSTSCQPRAVQNCLCPGGNASVQECRDDGSGYGPCLACPGDSLDLAVPPGSDLSASVGDLSVSSAACPSVMILFDITGSTGATTLPNTTTTHLDAERTAVASMLAAYATRFPFGLTTYDGMPSACTIGITTTDEPQLNNAASINTHTAATTANGQGNNGDAVNKVAADPNLIPGSYIIMITDGDPNCMGNAEPSFTVTALTNARARNITTYVVVINPDFTTQQRVTPAMESIAQAGGAPCTSAFCQGHKFYWGRTQAQLNRALDLVMNDIVQRQGGSCAAFACFPSGQACSGSTCCGTTGCANLDSDSMNCGSCGNVCAAGACSGGSCPVVDMALPVDMVPPADLARPAADMALPFCTCSPACAVGNVCNQGNCCSPTKTCGPSTTCRPR